MIRVFNHNCLILLLNLSVLVLFSYSRIQVGGTENNENIAGNLSEELKIYLC